MFALPLLENSSTVAVYHRPEIWRLQLHLLACFLIPKAVALPLDQSLSLPEFFSLFVVFYASTSSRSSLQARSLSFNVQPLKAALRSRKSCDKLISCSTHVQPTASKKGSKKNSLRQHGALRNTGLYLKCINNASTPNAR